MVRPKPHIKHTSPWMKGYMSVSLKWGLVRPKKEGQLIEKRPDWETHKYIVMYEVLVEKFKDRVLRGKLLETGEVELVEGNYWCDQIWGSCTCDKHYHIDGLNMLGRTLMRIRQEIRDGKL